MLDRYLRLLEAAAREPELPIGKLLAMTGAKPLRWTCRNYAERFYESSPLLKMFWRQVRRMRSVERTSEGRRRRRPYECEHHMPHGKADRATSVADPRVRQGACIRSFNDVLRRDGRWAIVRNPLLGLYTLYNGASGFPPQLALHAKKNARSSTARAQLGYRERPHTTTGSDDPN